tara:strand:- start:1222 stop:2313 length:1092 start_codon:yes stop_codon:yes gene_type:complete
MFYHDIIKTKTASEMTDEELVFCLLNTPLSTLGDAYDEKFWSRRISLLIKIGVSLGHPDIIDVFDCVEPEDQIEVEKHRFDVCVSRGNKIVTICELKCLAGISENQLEKYSKKLETKKSKSASRYLISLFDPNYDQVPDQWKDISLCYFSEAFREISEVLVRNPAIANDFLNCHDFLILVDELAYRFDSDMNNFDDNTADLIRIKEMALRTDFFKPLDRIVQQVCASDACKTLEKNKQDFFLHAGNTRGNNYFNIFTSVEGVEVGVQFQNGALKLYRNSQKDTPELNEILSRIANFISKSERGFSIDRGKGFRSIRLNALKSKCDPWTLEGKKQIIKTCVEAIILLNSISCKNEMLVIESLHD